MLFEAMDLYGTLDVKSYPMDTSNFEKNFKRTINCPATRANTNEPSKDLLALSLLVTYVTQQWSCYESFSLIVT